ncbi:uncharacterized protein LOC132720025 [Ruditapes philippinarum]|uniref:uncharacterized protein LOC132720025 n=1 Tax=Ruditapes philippinarum TaxID=129788 RepID=UPI00295A69B3|nr:uncharacterized protein LOC132720025 [Ruditapes philippinarum]
MSAQAVKKLSVTTNTTMDLLGFSEEMIKSRGEIVKQLVSIYTDKLQTFGPCIKMDCMVTGSAGEGISVLGKSDIDLIEIFRNFLCLDNAQVESELCMIQTITADSPPGYTKLNLLKMNSNIAAMGLLGVIAEYDLRSGQVLLHSTCIRNLFEIVRNTLGPYLEKDGAKTELRKQEGPSVPSTYHLRMPLMSWLDASCDFDFVIALPYISSTVLDSWRKRDRFWPPQSVCQDIIDTEAYVVPVGASCSENQNYEWRISFTTAENRLVSHLNPMLLKIYILFKMVNKYLIKPKSDILTSYMIKNVMFWMPERIGPGSCNSSERLINFLLQALAFLLNCLHSKFLPNYMIQERNLLLGKGKPCDITQLTCIISNLLDTGGFFIIRIEKLRVKILSIEKCLTDAKRFSEMRDKVEIMLLRMNLGILTKLSPEKFCQSSFIYDAMFEMFKDPLFFDVLFTLMKFLNLDMISLITNPQQIRKAINDVLFS